MITELCLYLHNWFNYRQPKVFDTFVIEDGSLSPDWIKDGQYYRIVGSVFNDGVYKHGSEELVDEEFDGAIWLMAVPKDVEELAKEIAEWQKTYGGAESQSMSPYNSESFGGYSYSKSGGSSGTLSSVPTWQSVYADRLARYRKI